MKLSSFLQYQVDAGVATITVNRPQARNALNPALIHQLRQAMRQAAADVQVRGIVLCGAGETFVAGADVGFFLRIMESGDLEPIAQFTRAAHELLNEIDGSRKPVVAAVHGPAIGGGLELALTSDRILVAPRARLALPETGLGIFPALGGTQRTPRRVGIGLAKGMIYTGKILPGEDARRIGLADAVVPPEQLPAAARETISRLLAGEDGNHAHRDSSSPPLSGPFAAWERFFACHRVDDLLKGTADTEGNPQLVLAMRQVSARAPLALRLAERLIDEGMQGSLDEGLEMEIAHSTHLFGTRDAYERLSALSKQMPIRA